MFVQINSGGIRAVRGFLVNVEADAGTGLPGFSMVGHLAPEVREAQDRVRTAMKNTGFRLPARKITVSLSPGNVRKEGTQYDLPIAAAVLGAYGMVDFSEMRDSMILGELGLDGRVKPVRGVLSLTAAAREQGLKRCFVPEENAAEAALVEKIQVIPVKSLAHMVSMAQDPVSIRPYDRPERKGELLLKQPDEALDFCQVKGQACLRRGAEIAAAGMHNLLLGGPAGTGKTMVARRIPSILPPLDWEEAMEISKVYSICGQLPENQPLITKRPFRSPHHTVTVQALTGGGRPVRPGEFSLASGGVLFLDEFTLFSRAAVEILRQPLEEHRILVSRVYGVYEFPADFMLCAAMNPCPCGFYPDRSRCTCSETQIRQYLSRISRPIMERFDLCVEAAPLTYEDIADGGRANESSASIRKRVQEARRMQRKRFAGTRIRYNSRMDERDVEVYCRLGQKEQAFMKKIYQARRLSARTYHKVLKVARTIADLEQSDSISERHLAEAAEYRGLEERLWKS